MRGVLNAAAIAAALSFGVAPVAFAASQNSTDAMQAKSSMAVHSHVTTGRVVAFDASGHTLKLKNGTIYMLPATFKDPGIKTGQKLRVSWDMQNGKHEASAVTMAR